MFALPAWLLSPVTRYVAIGIAAVAFISWQRHDAAREARTVAEAQCVIRAQEAATAERERLERAMAETLATAERSRLEAEREIATLRETTDELLDQIRGAGGSCPVPPDVLERLRGIQ